MKYNIRILAGSTMPVNRGAMLDFMIRLAQTQMPDGQALVDREAVAEYLPAEVKSALIRRTDNANLAVEQQIAELTQGIQQTQEQFGQMIQELQQQDQQTMQALEGITQAIEHINQQLLQQQEENAKVKQESEQLKRDGELQAQGYNSGYADAQVLGEGVPTGDPLESSMPDELDVSPITDEPLPDDILQGIEGLTEDELELLKASNPQIAELLR